MQCTEKQCWKQGSAENTKRSARHTIWKTQRAKWKGGTTKNGERAADPRATKAEQVARGAWRVNSADYCISHEERHRANHRYKGESVNAKSTHSAVCHRLSLGCSLAKTLSFLPGVNLHVSRMYMVQIGLQIIWIIFICISKVLSLI